MDALVSGADEGRGKTAISLGQLSNKLSRGFPNGATQPGVMSGLPRTEHIDPVEGTGGTETS